MISKSISPLFKPRNKLGVTLLEVVMVLGVMAIVTVASVGFYNSAAQSQKIVEFTKNVGALANVIRKVYANDASYADISETDVLASASFPEGLRDNSSSAARFQNINNPFGGANIQLAPTGANDSQFEIEVAGVDRLDCFDIVNGLLTSFDEIVVGSSGNLSKTTSDKGDIQSECDPDTSGVVQITFVAR